MGCLTPHARRHLSSQQRRLTTDLGSSRASRKGNGIQSSTHMHGIWVYKTSDTRATILVRINCLIRSLAINYRRGNSRSGGTIVFDLRRSSGCSRGCCVDWCVDAAACVYRSQENSVRRSQQRVFKATELTFVRSRSIRLLCFHLLVDEPEGVDVALIQ